MNYSIEAVLFDADGTLINNLPILTEGVQLALQDRLGINVAEQDILQEAGKSLPDFLRTLFPASITNPEDLLRELRADFETYYLSHLSDADVFEGVEECLGELYGQYRLGVVSSRLSGVRADLARLGIGSYFDVEVTRQDTTQYKPHPAPLLVACERLGILPVRCVYVGDAVADVRAAKAAGMTSVALTYGANNINTLAVEKPDVLVEAPSKLCAVINNLITTRKGELV